MRELVKKSNLLLITFAAADPAVKSCLLHSHCLSLYGCSLWNLNCATFTPLRSPLTIFSGIIIWHLPRSCHTHILHLTACLPSILNSVVSRSAWLIASALSCSLAVVHTVFQSSSFLTYTPAGYNALLGKDLIKNYYSHGGICASVIMHLRLHGSLNDSTVNDMIYVISTS